MRKYVPRPGASERKIVRRSNVTRDVSRSRPHSFVKRRRAGTVGRSNRLRRLLLVRTPGFPVRALSSVARLRVGIRALAAGLLLLALAAAAAWLWRSSYFEVKTVEVSGALSVAPEEVIAAAGLEGQQMITADLGEAQQRVSALPLVRSARAERRWPDTIVLTIEERTPWGTWEQAGIPYAIDREGVVLGPQAGGLSGPYVISAEPTSLRQGDRVSYQAVDAVAEIYDLLPRTLGTDVSQIAFVPGRGVQVTTEDGQTALLGDSSSIAYKLAVWAAVEEEAVQEHLNYGMIDLRWGNRPVLQ